MNPRRILAAIALSAATAFGGWLVGHTTAAPADAVKVEAFNDGWTDAMADACDQDSAYACDWLSR
ncbi:hypothetical protein ACFVUY_19410 [Kitasatospora sp. NPDC058063]|uniref:hypothetical protein n=1 Tax=unclassified Kitasatospora TaxID=2633591 RepID=UPI0036DC6A17